MDLTVFIIDNALYGVILFITYLILNKVFVRAKIAKILIPLYIIKVVCNYFELSSVSALMDVTLIGLFITIIILNEEKVKKLLKRKRTTKTFTSSSESERKVLYQVVDRAVNVLSSNKIGGLMTFEKNNSLEEYIKVGVKIDAPIKAELLTTIFYPGTTLHDGAVIIRGNTIEAASVYFTPTTKALKGKYGARHRAAIGISEVCDAITVVISEETGRISIAMDGELQAVNRENFVHIFKELMESEI